MSNSKFRGIVLACAALLACGPAAAQTGPATQPAPKPGPAALGLIPEDCLGFVLIRSAEQFAGKLEAFLKQTVPGLVPADFKIMDGLNQAVGLGETLNPKGSFAMVMLSLSKHAPDLAKPAPEEEVGGAGVKFRELPVAFVVPGKDPARLFRPQKAIKDGRYFCLPEMGREPAWALEADGFVVLSPNRKTIEAFPPGKSIASRLSGGHRDMLERYDAVAWVDRKACRGLTKTRLVAGIPQRMGLGKMFLSLPVVWPILYVRMTRSEIFNQAEALAFGARIEETGLTVEARWSYPADSLIGKALAAFPKGGEPLLTRLPDFPYVFAYGATKDFKTPMKLKAAQIDGLLRHKRVAAVPEETKAEIRQIILGIQEQVTGVKHYFGPSGKQGGPVGAISVVECKSPEKLKKLIDRIPPAAEILLRKLLPDEERFQSFIVKHYKGVEAVGDVKADAIVIENPDLLKFDEDTRAKMTTVWGDDKFRFLIAQVDEKTLVVTFGGGTRMLAEAIKAAKAKANLAEDAAVKPVLARLPRRRSAAGIFNLANAMNLYMYAAVAMGAAGAPPWRFHSKTPLAGAVSIEKTDLTFTGYIPFDPIREIYETMTRPPGPPPGP